MADCVDLKLQLITRRIPEDNIYGEDIIKRALSSDGLVRTLWATSPTGRPHIGYFIPMLKFAEFLKAGIEIIVLLLDVYSFLDNVKYPMEQVVHRMNYYKYTVMAALETLGISSDRVRFVEESSYQFTQRFIFDQWRLCVVVPQQAVRDAWDRSYNPDMLGPMFCPGLQTLAEEHLDIDFQFGGADQRGIFKFAERYLPVIGYKKRAHIMNPMLPNLYGDKMSSSHPPHTKIMFLDDPEAVRTKIVAASEAGATDEKRGVLACVRDILIPISELHSEGIVKPSVRFYSEDAPEGTMFMVHADGDDDRRLYFKSYQEIEKALLANEFSLNSLTDAVAEAVNGLLEPVRRSYQANTEWQIADMIGYREDA